MRGRSDRTSDGHQFPGHGCGHSSLTDLPTYRGFGSQATKAIDVLGLLFDIVIHGCFYNQALADVRSIAAGIKFCTVLYIVSTISLNDYNTVWMMHLSILFD